MNIAFQVLFFLCLFTWRWNMATFFVLHFSEVIFRLNSPCIYYMTCMEHVIMQTTMNPWVLAVTCEKEKKKSVTDWFRFHKIQTAGGIFNDDDNDGDRNPNWLWRIYQEQFILYAWWFVWRPVTQTASQQQS